MGCSPRVAESDTTERLHFNFHLCVLVSQSCPTLCDPMDCGLPGFSVLGVLQARILWWIAFPSPEELPNPGIEPWSPASKADSLPFELQGSPNRFRKGVTYSLVNLCLIFFCIFFFSLFGCTGSELHKGGPSS